MSQVAAMTVNETVALPYELSILSQAHQSQQWIMQMVSPYLGESILELGSGIGNMSQWLPVRKNLICSEMDPTFFQILKNKMQQKYSADGRIHFKPLDLNHSWAESVREFNLDTIISFNVIEHIENDSAVFKSAYQLLKESSAKGPKRIVSFVPAHQWAFGTLDEEFQHFRRYDQERFHLLAKELPGVQVHCQYFNLFGLPGWYLLGKVLRKRNFGSPTVKAFDALVPFMRPIDNFLHLKLGLPMGQTIIGVYTLT